MPYASGRTYYDADSHLMELADWLAEYADPDVRERIRPLSSAAPASSPSKAIVDAETRARRSGGGARARGRADGRQGLERARRVRSGRAHARARPARLREAARVQHLRGDAVRWRRRATSLYGGTRAHNRAIVDFCSDDPRLDRGRHGAVGRSRARRARRPTRRSGSAAARSCVPSVPAGRPVARRIRTTTRSGRASQEANIPFMLAHRRRRPAAAAAQFHNNGKPGRPTSSAAARTSAPRTSWSIAQPARDVPLVHGARRRVRALPAPARRLHRAGRAVGAELAAPARHRAGRRSRRPSRRCACPSARPSTCTATCGSRRSRPSPSAGSIEQAGDDLFLFSSDYPHPEGGRDPLRRFEESLGAAGAVGRENFYSANFTR